MRLMCGHFNHTFDRTFDSIFDRTYEKRGHPTESMGHMRNSKQGSARSGGLAILAIL